MPTPEEQHQAEVAARWRRIAQHFAPAQERGWPDIRGWLARPPKWQATIAYSVVAAVLLLLLWLAGVTVTKLAHIATHADKHVDEFIQ